MRIALIAIGSIALSACGTPNAADVPDGTRDHTRDLATGQSGSEAGTRELSSQVSGAYMGDSSQSTVDARATRNTSASTSGHILKGFDFGGSATMAEVASQLESDPVVAAIKSSLAAEHAKEEPDPARVDKLVTDLREYIEGLRQAASKMGGDLSGLSKLVVVNIMNQATGAEPKALTDAEAQAAAQGIRKAVEASRQ